MLLNELLNSSSSSSDEEMMVILIQNKENIPKVQNMLDIINEYSDEQVCIDVILIYVLKTFYNVVYLIKVSS